MPEDPVTNARPVLLRQGAVQEDMMEAVHQIHIVLPIDGRATAELTLVNWGRRESETGFQWLDLGLGDAMEIAFVDQEQQVFSGEITAIEERYGDGAPMLVLLLEDRLHRLAKQRRSAVYEDQSADDVISTLVSGLGVSTDISVSTSTGDWHQLNETDLNFIRRLAGRWAVATRIADGALRVKPEEASTEPLVVTPQGNARAVRIIADLNHQVPSSGMRGWNFQDGSLIEDSADYLQPPAQGSTAADAIGQLGWAEQEWLAWPRPSSNDEARDWTRAAFARQARRFLHGDVVLQGSPTLRVGSEIELSEVSPRLQGRYRIQHLTHRFDREDGFVSLVQVQRPDWEDSA